MAEFYKISFKESFLLKIIKVRVTSASRIANVRLGLKVTYPSHATIKSFIRFALEIISGENF